MRQFAAMKAGSSQMKSLRCAIERLAAGRGKTDFGSVAHRSEQAAHNRQGVGSAPTGATKFMAYTYLLRHRPTGRVYYGARSADPEGDLFVRYFTEHQVSAYRKCGWIRKDLGR